MIRTIVNSFITSERLLQIESDLWNRPFKVFSLAETLYSLIYIFVHFLDQCPESFVAKPHWLLYGRHFVTKFRDFSKPFHDRATSIGDWGFCHLCSLQNLLHSLQEAEELVAR